MHWRHLTAAALLVVTLALVGGAVGSDVYALGDDHGLARNASIQEFEQEGVTSTNLTVLDVGLTVAKTHGKADIDGHYVDVNKQWVCVDYRENISRTLRFELPAAYADPRPGESESVTTDHHVSYRVTPDGNATRVEIAFDQAARPCFALRKSAGWYFDVKLDATDWLNKTTGWSPPTLLQASQQWQRLPPTAWQNTSEYRLTVNATDLTMQYDDHPGTEESWLPVPDCSNPADQAVCVLEEQTTDGNTTVTLLSTQDDPPPVRYKLGSDRSATLGSAIEDIRQAFGSFLADLGDLFGGGGGGSSGGGDS